jgi:hypothetical protein
MKSSADSALLVAPKPQGRSRVSNRSAVLPGVDGRSTWVRRLRDLIGLYLSDVGGDARLSECQVPWSRGAPIQASALVERQCYPDQGRGPQRIIRFAGGRVEDAAERMMLSLCQRLGRDLDATRADMYRCRQREQPVFLGGETVNRLRTVAKAQQLLGQHSRRVQKSSSTSPRRLGEVGEPRHNAPEKHWRQLRYLKFENYQQGTPIWLNAK